MTSKQTDAQWKARVEKRLDRLEAGSGEMMTLIQHIDKNLSALVAQTAPAVAMAAKAHWWGKVAGWAGQSLHKAIVKVGELGFGILMLSTIVYIITKSNTIRDFFLAFKWN